MERILIYLTAVAGLAKDLHYEYAGTTFYGNHLLMDRIYDDIYDLTDEIKENYYMYLGKAVPTSEEIFSKTAEILKNISTVDVKTRTLIDYMKNVIYLCDEESKKDKYDCGDNDLLGRIASKMKNGVALLSRVIESTKETE